MVSALRYLLPCHVAMASLPDTMKAGVILHHQGSELNLDDFREIEVATPAPKAGEVLIQVAGSSVNPIDWKAALWYSASWPMPTIMGRDCAGTVAAVGADVTRLKVGDAVWADTTNQGCYGQYVAMEETRVGVAPSNIPLSHAGVMPLVSLTSLEAFQIAQAPWKTSKTVLLLGGSGGTGHVGLQIAKALGATKLITTCGTSHVEFCKNMGADQVIDYHVDNFYDVIPALSVDVVYDTVGIAGTGDQAYGLLKNGGTFVSILGGSAMASPETAASRPSVHQEFFLCDASDYRQLDILKGFVEAEQLVPVVGATYPVSDFSDAFALSMSHHALGKISVVPSDATAKAVAV